MSGHSKWSTIKRKKAAIDQARGKVFSKLVKEIMMASKLGDPDPSSNTRLRLAIQKAKEANMPRDNIDRAVKKGSGDDNNQMEEVTFEAYGPNGVAILINVMTDNRNRTVPNLKHILAKNGGNLATNGSVSYLFEKKGLFIFEPGSSEESIMDVGLDAGAEDIKNKDDGSIEVICDTNDYENIKNAFDSEKVIYESAEITMLPTTIVNLDEDGALKILKLIESIEEDDDVQEVFGNYDISEEILAKLDI